MLGGTLFELSNGDAPTAAVLMRDLEFDAGYLGWIVQRHGELYARHR
ncbi:MAG: hypothetical protein ABI664_15750 [bacterium]